MKYSRVNRTLSMSAICLMLLLQLPTARADLSSNSTPIPTGKKLEAIQNGSPLEANSPDSLTAGVCDFNGDGKADLALYLLPLTWIVKLNVGSTACTWTSNCKGYVFNLGTTGADVIVAGDYDNSPGKKTNLAVRQGLPLTPGTPSTYTFAPDLSLPPMGGIVTGTQSFTYGFTTDVPVMGDFDGDSLADYAAVRPVGTLLTWYVQSALNVPITQPQWGNVGDYLIPGDYNGDAITDITVWRPSTGTWHWLVSPSFVPQQQLTWGVVGDKPLLGNFDGDPKDDMVVYRPSTGTWHIRYSSTGVYIAQQWGLSTDIPVPADYDGDGKTDIAVYRPGTSQWFIMGSNVGFMYDQFGFPGFKPVAAEYVKAT